MEWKDALLIDFCMIVFVFGLMGYITSRDRRRRVEERIDRVEEKMHRLSEDLNSLCRDVKNVERRLVRLEARFEERGCWESREFKNTVTEKT
jgi:predicted  nucleic acid-binding Zn-ribbon protein